MVLCLRSTFLGSIGRADQGLIMVGKGIPMVLEYRGEFSPGMPASRKVHLAALSEGEPG